MKILRHQIMKDRVTRAFQRELADFESFLQGARRDTSNLSLFLMGARKLVLAGGVVAPDAPEAARVLRLAAQAATGLFTFAEITDPPRSIILGEGPPVSNTQPTNESHLHLLAWKDAFYLDIITRQHHLTDEICRVPTDLLRRSSTGPLGDRNGPGYRFIDLLKAVWTKDRFTLDPAFVEWEGVITSGPGGSAPNNVVRCNAAPLLRLLRQLESRDQAAFAQALTEALRLQKEYWSSTEELRKDFNGFVSLPLTAVAALAWDRGLRFEVDSDYLPMSWVRGDLFQTPS